MRKVLETTIIKHDKKMEIKTHKEMLDKYIGEVGTPERDAFDAQVRAGAEEYRIGEAIKQTRKKIGFTQQQLGERMGVKRAEVSKIESGRSITYSTIMRAFKALGAETATLDLGRLGRVALW
jgi:ribosome-binding protein aMBF1 (putative translation factor)